MIRHLISLVLLVALLLPVGVWAQNQGSQNASQNQSAQQNAAAQNYQERKNQSQAQLQTSLTQQRRERIVAGCQNALSIAAQRLVNADTANQTHTTTIDESYDTLAAVAFRLEVHHDVDVTDFRNSLTQLSSMSQQFDDSYQLYIEALGDVSSDSDCSQQPLEFAAGLDVARETIEQLQTQNEQITNHLQQQVLPLLDQFKVQLDSQSQTGEGNG